MSEDAGSAGLWPIQGDGVLARQGDLVLLVHPAGGPFTDRLLDLLADADRTGEDGRRFADLVSAAFDADAAAAADTARNGPDPAAVAFGPDGSGTAVTVYGTAWAEIITAHGVQLLSAGQPYGRLRCVLPARVIKVRAGVHAGDSNAATDRYLRLVGGIVRAVGLLYVPESGAGPEPAGPVERVVSGGGAVAEPAGPVERVVSGGGAVAEPAGPVERVVSGGGAVAEPAGPVERVVSGGGAVAEPAGPVERVVSGGGAVAEPAGPVERVVSGGGAVAEPAGPVERVVSGGGAVAEPAGPVEQAMPDIGDRGKASAPMGDFIAVALGVDQADVGSPRRKALPLGSEPPDEKDVAIGERPPPVVIGVYCKRGHFDDPEARYCAVCGIGMAQLTKVPRPGTRPPLGVLVLDDGSVFQLNAHYVIGREPSLDASVAGGDARPLRLAGASGLVSRIHARVDLDGWQVYVSDLNSANGTFIQLPGEKDGKRLAPGVRTPLVVGAQVRLGSEYGFRYDSHRHR